MRILSVLVLVLGLTCPALAQTPPPASLTLTGAGEIAAAPDMATITLGVVSFKPTAAQAMAETSASTAKIIDALKAAGIDGADLQTRDLSLNPRWKNRPYKAGEAPEIEGFTASNTLMVRVRDLDVLGGVLDQVVQLGANQFRGLSFGLQEPEPAQDDARRAAVAEAMRKAQLYAEAAGVTLGPILSISETGRTAPQPVMMMEAARMSADVPVEGGEVSVSAQVTMVFAIDP